MKKAKILIASLVGVLVAASLGAGVMAAEEVVNGGDIWNDGTNWLTNTTYSEYYTERCNHGAKAWGNGEVVAKNSPCNWVNARTAMSSNNGWIRWDESLTNKGHVEKISI